MNCLEQIFAITIILLTVSVAYDHDSPLGCFVIVTQLKKKNS